MLLSGTKKWSQGFLGAVVISCAGLAVAAPVKLEFSHKLDEEQAERIAPLIESFNQQNKDIEVSMVRRVAGDQPKQINLVSAEDYSRYQDQKAKFTPLYQVMNQGKIKLNANTLSPDLRDGVTDSRGRLEALPLAYSTPVLYINKEAFRKAGLNPDQPPRTWMEAQEVAGKLADSGNRCPFTTSWPAWVLVDNQSAWNGASVADSRGRLNFNGLVQIKHVAMMATWYKSNYFSYFGRRDEADRRFEQGECAMLTSTSSLYPSLVAKSMDVVVAPLPYHDDVYGAPRATLADGASIRIGSGLKPAEAKGVAKFVDFMMKAKVQAELTQAGGFLPMTVVARRSVASDLKADDAKGLKVASAELNVSGKNAVAVRPSQIPKVRDILDEELEAVWADRKPAKEALDNAVTRGNAVLSASSGSKRRL